MNKTLYNQLNQSNWKSRIAIYFICMLPLSSFSATDYQFKYQHRESFALKSILKQQMSSTNMIHIELSASGDHYLGDILIANAHGDSTVKALKGILSDSCLDFLIEEIVNVDKGEAKTQKRNHFDDNSICESHHKMETRYSSVRDIQTIKSQLQKIGEIIHAIQDFYSHSNYVQASLAKNNSLSKEEIDLFDFKSFCPSQIEYKNLGVIFTGDYQGDHGLFDSKLTPEDLSNPHSHLHWNKDFSPYKNYFLAKIYSRSSLLKSNRGKGDYYFDYTESLQVKEIRRIIKGLTQAGVRLDMKCKL